MATQHPSSSRVSGIHLCHVLDGGLDGLADTSALDWWSERFLVVRWSQKTA